MKYEIFRLRALQGLSLLPPKQRNIMSKDQIEKWVKEQYNKHYKKNA